MVFPSESVQTFAEPLGSLSPVIVPLRSMLSVRSSTLRVVILDAPSMEMPLARAALVPVDLPISVTLPVLAVIVVPESNTPAASAVVLPASSTLPPAVPPASVVLITA